MNREETNGIKKYLGRHAVSLVLALLVQSGALIWWASAITTRMEYVEREVQELCLRIRDLETNR